MKDGKIYGYINFENSDVPFVYEDGILNLLPNNIENCKKEKIELLKKLADINSRNEEIKPFKLEGMTIEENGIEFLLDGKEGNNNGLKSYNVILYHIYFKKMYDENNGICGLHFMSEELNQFLKPYLCYEYYMLTDENPTETMNIGVDNQSNLKKCGSIRYLNNIIKFEIDIIPKAVFKSKSPLHSFTRMSFDLKSVENDIFNIYKMIYLQKTFLSYICYRKNIDFNNIETFIYTEQGQKYSIGNIVLIEDITEETNKGRAKIIPFNAISNDINAIMKDLKNNNILMRHYSNCYDETHNYTTAKVIGIFSAFERECELCGINVRNDDYINVKERAIIKINDLKAELLTSKEKKYLKEIQKTLKNINSSMKDFFYKVFIDNFEIMQPIIKNTYCMQVVSKRTVNAISNRLNKLRNAIVHGSLDFKFQSKNLLDLKVLEMLIYVNRLKSYNIENDKIFEILNSLF